ncbi:hypothetical protein KUCAC02_023326 [Chaenocephalus aceratus]|uniref:Uncharacterized protein n=1 Tax=Chaenocephalus aceratus TaxID=36190 RepID=A0ACB9XR89_CHAAC|nr:hypothetical protein KUCAC02_023326 [Chaenocephalus aceratus]
MDIKRRHSESQVSSSCAFCVFVRRWQQSHSRNLDKFKDLLQKAAKVLEGRE